MIITKKISTMDKYRDSTDLTSTKRIEADTSHSTGTICFLPSLPANTFKKNGTVKFKHKRKNLSGKIVKIGHSGVDVNCNGLYYYCSDYDKTKQIFLKSDKTKNYR